MVVSTDNMPAQVYFLQGKNTLRMERNVCKGHFLFIFVRSGIVRSVIDSTRISCTSNELIIALCRNYFQVLKCSKDTACYLVKVRWQFLTDIKMSSKFIDLLVSRHVLKTLPDSYDSRVIKRIMKLLYYYYQTAINPVRFPISSFKAALSLLIFQAAWQEDNALAGKEMTYSRKEMLAMQFLKLLVQHYRQENATAFYARQLFVTGDYLNRAVREVTGRTVGKCIAEIVLSEAKYLLLSTDLTIETISEQLHFNSVGSFSRFFKRLAAISPSQYRKEYSE